MDHISTGAASARHPDISRRSRRHVALRHAQATRGETRHKSPRDEIPAQVGGYLSVSSHALGTHGVKAPPLGPSQAPHSEQRREHR